MPPAGFEPEIPAIERPQTACGWVGSQGHAPAAWAPVPVWMGAGNLAATGIRTRNSSNREAADRMWVGG